MQDKSADAIKKGASNPATDMLRTIVDQVSRRTAMIPRAAVYILAMFVVTRLVLTFIGVVSRSLVNGQDLVRWTDLSFLNIWGVWDSTFYLRIAEIGYNDTTILAFFPLYPLLIKLLNYIVGNPYIAGVIVSNVCLLVACYYMYRLTALEEDEETSLNSVKYLLIYPTAFVLSGVFTESLYLMLIVMSFYYAKKGRWPIACVLGLFLAMTRSIGVFLILPLAYEYIKSKEFKLNRIKPDIALLLLIPLGFCMFMAYNFYLTGDPVAFMHSESAWGKQAGNPIIILYQGLAGMKINAFIALAVLGLITVFYKKIGFSYWLVGVYSIMVPLTASVGGMHRYSLAVFPLFILLAKLGKDTRFDRLATIALVMLQGCFMVIWTNQIALE